MSKLRIDLNKYKPRKEQVKALEFIDMVEKKNQIISFIYSIYHQV